MADTWLSVKVRFCTRNHEAGAADRTSMLRCGRGWLAGSVSGARVCSYTMSMPGIAAGRAEHLAGCGRLADVDGSVAHGPVVEESVHVEPVDGVDRLDRLFRRVASEEPAHEPHASEAGQRDPPGIERRRALRLDVQLDRRPLDQRRVGGAS